MTDRNTWTEEEIDRLIRAYPVLTIKELRMLFPWYNANMINSKIRRLKNQGLIDQNKNSHTKEVALKQRTWSRQIAPGVFNEKPDAWLRGKSKK
jgi:hypothetical protein